MCDKLGPQFPVHCQTSKCLKYLCKKMMTQKYFFKTSKKLCFHKTNGLYFTNNKLPLVNFRYNTVSGISSHFALCKIIS